MAIFYNQFIEVEKQNIIIRVATVADKIYSKTITDEMEASAAARGTGIAKRSPDYIEQKIFNLSKEKYPDAKIFGLTTGLAVMKINSDLGYEPVTYSELTQDESFWAGCKSCVNYEILMSKERKNCMCTAMLYDPKDHYEPEETKEYFKENMKGFERLLRFKQWKLLRPFMKKDNGNNNESKPKSFLQLFFNI